MGGLPGIGKSTFIKRTMLDVCVLSIDDYIAPGAGGWPQFEEDITDAFALGHSIVIDATACSDTFREWCIEAAAEAGREAHLLLLEGDLEMAVEGQRLRGRELSAETMQEYYARAWPKGKGRCELRRPAR
jgi:predicted kinase